MRNQYPGVCYRCNEMCASGDGHFERLGTKWRVQHAKCAIKFRGTVEPVREATISKRRLEKAAGTGRAAQKARKKLRDMEKAEEVTFESVMCVANLLDDNL